MRITSLLRRSGVGLLTTVAVAGLAAGCSSSGSKASPIPAGGTGTAPTTVVAAPRVSDAAKTAGVEPSSADLDALDRDLQSAGRDLDAASPAIKEADVDTAKNQEGSAP